MNTYDAKFIDHEINDLIENEHENEEHRNNIKKINNGFKKVRKYLQKTKEAIEYGMEWKGF